MVKTVSWNSNGRTVKIVTVIVAAAVNKNSRGKTVK